MDSQKTPPEGQPPAEQMIWNTSPQNPQQFEEHKQLKPPRKRHRWGFLEVFISVLALIAVQVAYSLVVMTAIIQEKLGSGANLDDIDAVTNEILTEITTAPQHLAFFLVSMYVIWIGTMFAATFFRGLKSFAKDFWLRFNWKRDIPLGIAIAVGLRGAEFLVFGLIGALGVDLSGVGNTNAIIDQQGLWYFLIAIVFASFVGPICEELFFRGLLLQAFLRNFRRGNISKPRGNFGQVVQNNSPGVFNAYMAARNWMFRNKYILAVAFSGILFGLMHFQGTNDIAGWIPVIETGIIGILFGYIVIKTKQLGLVIVIHCAFNLSGVVLATLMS